ncbi:hypothetical protein [Nannocystis pusilla]|uniref:ATPase PglY C-terminal domain-containing protein n=1 Tax=Nannocystis pusilla TaxID=889268 RepID=A0ABS7TPC5_9BACT|nr:hypothetical protein [Nannocystis pusilla]MBZ5710078.1 hypothetical protein [Nannocystis pusilla]
MSTQIRDLFQLPAEIRPMDFTVVLADGISRPEDTVATYRVTPALQRAFTQSLDLVATALRDGRSQAAYLHGSFGTGKSHFMALLSLLLAGDRHAWSLPELASLRSGHPWTGERELLQLRLHMLDQPSFEGAIFGAYLGHLRVHHPDAPLPLLFADTGLFNDADALREQLGDAAFFAALGPPQKTGRWGKLANSTWDRARFDAARTSGSPQERADLLTALARTPFFRSIADEHRRTYVDFDTGLQELTRHAQALGYAAVVLFLDELILWLSMNAGSPDFISTWVGRMVKLVQGDHARRHIPLVSFVARQKELRFMIGEENVGPEQAHAEEVLKLAKGRFGEIRLEDENLPAIVEKRVLIPRDAAAVAAIDRTFAALEKSAGASWNTLLGGGHDRHAFRQVYPFSPVLVDALIRLSQLLQRQRTALRLLVELLHGHMDDVELGDLVGVGDLFDPLLFGPPPDDNLQAARFRAARQIYTDDLLPRLREANGTTTPDRCQRARDGARQDLGCSGCPVRACRNDNRIVKTLLISALIPALPAFQALTVKRLIQLNHGHIRSLIPGLEIQDVATRLRRLGQATGHIEVGRESDPSISIVLDQVDVQSIVNRAREGVKTGLCQSVLGALLFEALALPDDFRPVVDYKLDWRNTRRSGELVFGNVRRMSPEQLRCPDEHDFRVVIDYPFDEGSYGPLHDINALEEFTARGPGSWTLVWLPSFFSGETYRALEDLVAIDIVQSEPLIYLQHLSVEKQAAARNLLLNLQREKRSLLLDALEKAYGLAPVKDSDPALDRARCVPEPLRLLVPGERLAPSLFAPNLKAALASYIPALLETRWPHHPHFGLRLANKSVIESVLHWFDVLCDQPDHRLAELKRDELDVLRGTLGPLGVVRVNESAVNLVTDGPLQRVERRRDQAAVDNPTVDEVAAWHGEGFRFGLQPEALAVLVRCYARLHARTLVSGGRPWTPGPTLPGLVVLEKPELPRDEPWSRALRLAGAAFGLQVRASNTADNLQAFGSALEQRLRELGPAALALPDLLAGWSTALGLPDDAPRLHIARSASDLVRALTGRRPLEQVEVLASFTPHVSARAVGASLATAGRLVEQLGSALVRASFEQLHLRPDPPPQTAALLDELAELLHAGEHERSLVGQLQQLAERATRLNLQAVQPPGERAPPRPVPPDISRSTSGTRRWDPGVDAEPPEPAAPNSGLVPRRWDLVTVGANELDALLAELRAAGLAAPGPLRWQVQVQQKGR